MFTHQLLTIGNYGGLTIVSSIRTSLIARRMCADCVSRRDTDEERAGCDKLQLPSQEAYTSAIVWASRATKTPGGISNASRSRMKRWTKRNRTGARNTKCVMVPQLILRRWCFHFSPCSPAAPSQPVCPFHLGRLVPRVRCNEEIVSNSCFLLRHATSILTENYMSLCNKWTAFRESDCTFGII